MVKLEARFQSKPLDNGERIQYHATITEEWGSIHNYFSWELFRVHTDKSKERKDLGGMWEPSLKVAKRKVREEAFAVDGRIKWEEVTE